MKRIIVIFIYSLLLFVFEAPLRGGYITILHLTGLGLSLLVGAISYFILTIFVLRRYSKTNSKTSIIIALLLGATILELPFRIIHFESTLISLPDALFKLFAIFTAYGVFVIKKAYKIIAAILFMLVCVWMSYRGCDLWLNKLNFGTFIGNTEQIVERPIVFQDFNDNDIKLGELDGKYIILDFWSSTCGICFREFPKVQELYVEMNDKTDIRLYSVFCRISKRGETPKFGADRLVELGYTFPTISIDMDDPILKQIGVNIIAKTKSTIFQNEK